jgi:hypothetical protein
MLVPLRVSPRRACSLARLVEGCNDLPMVDDRDGSNPDGLQRIYDRLNHQFYAAEPADYFHTRGWLLGSW